MKQIGFGKARSRYCYDLSSCLFRQYKNHICHTHSRAGSRDKSIMSVILKYMQNIIIGIGLMVLGILSTLAVLDVLELNIFLQALLPVSVFLIGLLLILREQGRRAADSAAKATAKAEQARAKAELEQHNRAHKSEREHLRDELVTKDKIVETQGEVIDDMVNPKQPLDTR